MSPNQSEEDLQSFRDPGNNLLHRAGLHEVASHIGAINTTMSRVRLTLRADERAKRLSLPSNPDVQPVLELASTTVQGHAKEAKRLLKEQRGGRTWQTLKKEFKPRKDEIEPSLRQARAHWVEAIRESDVEPEAAVEMARMWDDAADTLRKKGIDGIFDYLDQSLGEFERVMTPEQDFGRQARLAITERALPQYEWWQWLIIIAIVGIVVGALVACLIWNGCAWIIAAYHAVCEIVTGTRDGQPTGWVGPCFRF